MGFSEKNLELFQIPQIWQTFCRMRIKGYYFFKKSFHVVCEVFLSTNQKIFEGGKFKIIMKKQRI